MNITETAKDWWHERKLVGKYSLLLAGAALLIIPTTQVALDSLMTPVFESIERSGIDDQKARVKHALAEFETSLQNATLDYAVWDDMYDYAQDRNHAFELETLSPVSHVNNGIDYRGIVQMDGTVIWSSAVDLEKMATLPAESEGMKAVLTEPSFFKRASASKTTISYVKAKRGIYLLTTAQIIKSDESGAPKGLMVNGILLSEKSLSETLQVAAKLNQKLNAAQTAAIASAKGQTISTTSPNAISTQIGLFGYRKDMLGSIDFETPRSITAAGASAIRTASIGVILAIIVLIALLGYGIRNITVRRLQALESYVRYFKINQRELHANLTTGNDELSSLARQFQALSEQLSEAEEQLQKRSYLQGKADSAAGMLHNVRNALAPVRVMQEKWLREETLPFRANLQKAVDELAQDGIDESRKADLERFLLSAARTIGLSTRGRLAEMEETKASVDQISEILSSYNFDTSSENGGDQIALSSVLKQALKTLSGRGGDAVEIDMPGQMATTLGNRVHLGQVLDNIFVNAHEAMTAAGASPMRLVITCEGNEGDETVILRIRDNGDGIAPENIPQAFQRGYSTRNHKAGGLGMHWSANAMSAMGGSIAIESEGAGMGATVSLTLRRVDAEKEALAA